MGYQEKTIGGGSAKELGANFTDFLNQWITTGSFGSGAAGTQTRNADPSKNSQDIFGLLNSIISNPQADKSVQDLISKDIERGKNDLRARFGSQGGMSFGSPAAFAEALYQSEQAPRTAVAMDQMSQGRLQALMPLFEMLYGTANKGISQAETVLEPKPWMQAVNLGLDVANTAANFIPGTPSVDNNRMSSAMKFMPNTSPQLAPIGGINTNMPRNVSPINFRPLPVGQQVYR